MLDFRPVCRDDLEALLHLEVAPHQRGFVAPNAITIAQNAYEPGSVAYGLWASGEAVGLCAVCDLGDPETILEPGYDRHGLDIWRLMVAAPHQGRGFGTAALGIVADMARARGRAYVRTSANTDPAAAIPFYERFGFRRTGEMDGPEAVLRLEIA